MSELIVILPFLLGRRFLGSSESNMDILRILTIAGVAYSIPMLFEVRMSPQLHTWVYGYFPHSFGQQMREGGFRPVVFLGHGLLVAFFAMTTVLASAALWRTRTRVFDALAPAGVTAWLGGVLLLCKSFASLIYAMVGAPLVLFARPNLQAWIAAVLVAAALTYPMLRTMDIFPTTLILGIAKSISPERADSLKVRFDQEQMLLSHASERLWFGWGRFGRGRVYDEWGKDITITDGHWIITVTTFGLFGFLAEFGLLTFSVFRAVSALRLPLPEYDSIHLGALTMIVTFTIIDQLPNASIGPWSWLLVGALLGRAERAIRSTAIQRRHRRSRPLGKLEPSPAVTRRFGQRN